MSDNQDRWPGIQYKYQYYGLLPEGKCALLNEATWKRLTSATVFTQANFIDALFPDKEDAQGKLFGLDFGISEAMPNDYILIAQTNGDLILFHIT